MMGGYLLWTFIVILVMLKENLFLFNQDFWANFAQNDPDTQSSEIFKNLQTIAFMIFCLVAFENLNHFNNVRITRYL